MVKYNRLPDESEYEYIYRVCKEKDLIGTWQDVADILNENLSYEYSESKYRKQYQAFEKMFKNNKKHLEDDTYLEEMKSLKRDIKKEKIKLQTEKLEYAKWLREDAREEMIVEKMCNAISSLPPLSIPQHIFPVTKNVSYLCCIADAHYGIEFHIKDLFGKTINQYSPEIFEDRMWKLFNKLLNVIKSEKITELNLWELGDGLQGILRLNSQLMKLRYGIIESSILYSNFLANWINELSNYVRIKFQMVMDSNHNQLRICNAPKNAFVDENMSRSMLTFIKERLKNNPNVEIAENPTGMNFDVLSDFSVLGIHGEVKNVETAINEFSRVYSKQIAYLVGAHCHHLSEKETGINSECLTVRSLIGVDPYGMSLRKASNSGASLFVFEKDLGKVCEYSLKVK